MAKPKTTYTPATKNKVTFTKVVKNAVSFTKLAKNKVTLTPVAKKPTSFGRNTSVASWLLNSTVVTLNSTLYRLNGYTTAIAPNQNDNKNVTTFTAL